MKKMILLGTIFALAGCSTIIRGGSEEITINTVPSGAQVSLSNGISCVSPCQFKVSRKDDLIITITKDGYKELKTAMLTTIDGASVGLGTAANLLFLPIINDVVDYNTRANYSHKPNPLAVTLIEDSAEEDYQLTATLTTEATDESIEP